MKVCFIAAGPPEWGSSRMRCYWVAPYMQDAQVIQFQQLNHEPLPEADVYIWQKNARPDLIKHGNGRHYLDVCDPSWWWEPEYIKGIADCVTGIVASSQALADDFNDWLKQDRAVCIPDRLEMSHFQTKREHTAVPTTRLIWYGVAVNRIALFAALANLERLAANGHKIELTIMDDRPAEPFRITNAFPVYHTQWSLVRETAVLTAHDIALLPPYPGPWGKVKSNNKALTAWACGLPVSSGEDYESLRMLVDNANLRAMSADIDLSGWDVRHSAKEWEELLNE